MEKVYCKNRKQHRSLQKLFAALAARLEDYDSPPKDVGYWYGERALTGFLAAAAWSLPRGWSLEEFTGLRMKGKKKGSGRGDIWVGIGNEAYTIEAKADWPGSNVDSAINRAEAKLSEAAMQLRQLDKSYRVGKPVSICYIIPDLASKGRFADPNTIREFFMQIPRQFSDSRTVVASFWYEKTPPRFNGRLYPGVVVVARLLPGWSK